MFDFRIALSDGVRSCCRGNAVAGQRRGRATCPVPAKVLFPVCDGAVAACRGDGEAAADGLPGRFCCPGRCFPLHAGHGSLPSALLAGAAHGIPPCPGLGTPHSPKSPSGGDAALTLREQLPQNTLNRDFSCDAPGGEPGSPLRGGIELLGQVGWKHQFGFPMSKAALSSALWGWVRMSRGTGIFSWSCHRWQSLLEQVWVSDPRLCPASVPGAGQTASSPVPKKPLLAICPDPAGKRRVCFRAVSAEHPFRRASLPLSVLNPTVQRPMRGCLARAPLPALRLQRAARGQHSLASGG